jgi:hypothetical protein
VSTDKAKVRIETAFLAIPDAIARDPGLSWSAKGLFACIYSLAHTSSGCYGSNDALAKRVGLSRRQVQRMLTELEDRKLIERHFEGPERDRPAIEVTWRPKIVKPRKRSDKLSKSNSDKMSPVTDPSYPPCDGSVIPPVSDVSYPPTMRRNGTKDKSKKTSGSDEPERFSSKSGQTPTDPMGPSSGPEQEDPEAVAAAWRAFRAQHGVGTKPRRVDANPCPPETATAQDDPILQAELARLEQLKRTT